MTAEIAILNKSAIALAADSKVTLTTGGGKQKTYDTVDKLFSLSKTEPVGAMIYGNAEFMRFPWETLIKQYRRQKPEKCFDTVFDWADDLKRYLTEFFPFNGNDEKEVILRIARPPLDQLLMEHFQLCQQHSVTLEDASVLLTNSLHQHIEELSGEPDLFDDNEWGALVERSGQYMRDIANRVLGDRYPECVDAALLFIQTLVRKEVVSNSASGLVVAGFGDKELLPSLVAFEIDGIIGGRLKHIEKARFDGTRDVEGTIIPFAQSDMVYRFMEGIDPGYAEQVRTDVRELLHRNALDTALSLGHSQEDVERISPAIEAATEASLNEFWQATSDLRRTQFAEPIIDMAMRLPKDELAHLAESLVSLTSLQRRVSREIETVGGAIDVAIISKGDGFVWIKRKHYFSADRNLRFVNAYFNEYSASRGHLGDKDDA